MDFLSFLLNLNPASLSTTGDIEEMTVLYMFCTQYSDSTNVTAGFQRAEPNAKGSGRGTT
jgi:hypothetical protein